MGWPKSLPYRQKTGIYMGCSEKDDRCTCQSQKKRKDKKETILSGWNEIRGIIVENGFPQYLFIYTHMYIQTYISICNNLNIL